jgi:hypothetical protein
MKYAHETPNTRVYDKFEYFTEDLDCLYCIHFAGNKVASSNGGRGSTPRTQAFARPPGCGCAVCEFADIKAEAIRKNRIKRAKGWNKWRE